MSDYSALKATINANVKANNNQEITGTIMNSVLNAMVNALGAGYQFIGVATPTNPGTAQTPDYKCFYLATTPGTYTYLGGEVVADGEVALFMWDTAWHKVVTGVASADKLNQLGQKVKLPIIWNKGYLNNGIPVSNNSRHYSNLLPIVDGFSYEVCNTNVNRAFYSGSYMDSEHYLGSTYSSSAKFVAFWFDDSQVDYDTLTVFSQKAMAEYLADTSFSPQHNGVIYTPDATKRKAQYQLVRYAIKGFYFYGNSVDKTATYSIMFQKSASTLRILIYGNTSSALIDKSITIPADGIIDSIQTNGGYSFRIIADCSIADNASGTSVNDHFSLTKNAFTPFIGDLRQIEVNKNDIASLQSQMNDANAIDVQIKETEEVDYLSYFEAAKGGESGYVSSINGNIGSNSGMTRTAYLPLDGVVAIKTKTPSGSTAGLAFYSGNNQAQYATEFISGINSENGGDGNSWISVPSGAKYLRTTVRNSDLTGETAIFIVRRYKKESLQEFVDGMLSETTKPEPRATHVFYGYEGFCDGLEGVDGEWIASQNKLTTARKNLVLTTQNNNIRQIVSERQLYVNKMKYEVAFEVNDANSFFSIGTKGLSILNELRVRNDNGSALFEIYAGSGGADTYEPDSPRVVISRIMSFALVAGNVYKLGMRKFENETYNNVEHMDGVVYYIQSYADNVLYEEFVPRDTTRHEDIRNGITASCKGVQFVSLKVGDVTVDNIFVSSEYDTRAKAIILGDSIVDGDTLIGTDTSTGCGQKNKYACLLQSAIGMNSFVIAGKGGDSMSQGSIPYLMKEVELFAPGYCILAFGANHSTFDGFKTNMEFFCSWLVSIGVTPILETVCPASGRSAELIAQMSNWVRNSGYRYVDLNKAVTVDGLGVTWIDGYVNADGTHPTVLGHSAIFETFQRELPELFSV